MEKYSVEFKLSVVKYYNENDCGSILCAKHFNISSSSVKLWNRQYKKWGLDGLGDKKAEYDGNFKLYVVEYIKLKQLSLMEALVYFNLSSMNTIKGWLDIYDKKGPQALLEGDCDGNEGNNMKKRNVPKDKATTNDSKKIKNNTPTYSDLQKEVEYLRMENEYLKKLNALVQKRNKSRNKTK